MSYSNFVETIEKIMKFPNQFDKQDWEIWNEMKRLYESDDSRVIEQFKEMETNEN